MLILLHINISFAVKWQKASQQDVKILQSAFSLVPKSKPFPENVP